METKLDNSFCWNCKRRMHAAASVYMEAKPTEGDCGICGNCGVFVLYTTDGTVELTKEHWKTLKVEYQAVLLQLHLSWKRHQMTLN